MFIYLDTETTGTGPDDRLCQIAFKPENGPAVSGLFNPGKPISIDAMAIHHITEKMVQDKPPFQESDEHAELKKLVSDINNVIVAHNAKFDMQMLEKEGIYTPRVTCTLKLARWPGWTHCNRALIWRPITYRFAKRIIFMLTVF